MSRHKPAIPGGDISSRGHRERKRGAAARSK
jgi:hypothetical protein